MWRSVYNLENGTPPLDLVLLQHVELRLQELIIAFTGSSEQARAYPLPWEDPDPLWTVDQLEWDQAIEVFDDERFKEALERAALTL